MDLLRKLETCSQMNELIVIVSLCLGKDFWYHHHHEIAQVFL